MESPKTSNDAQQHKKKNSNHRSRNSQTKESKNGSAAQPLNQKSKSADPKAKGHSSQTMDKKNANGEKMNANRPGRSSHEAERRNFPDYYRPDVVQHALEKNVLFSGLLRIHQVSLGILIL